ncbi:MAG: phosphoribosyl-AMP cyclohydrolase [Halobacteriales archaeon]|jgi:phosphoribosyl-AMP cyclohydrolase
MTLDLAPDDDGLLTVVAQDDDTDEVLMVAHADRTALERTLETGVAHYYSRSRDERWRKGETSGHVQHVREVRVDCDGDALLYRVDQTGGACHTGHRSCFYRRVEADGDGPTATVVEEPTFDPDEVYD